MNAAGLAHIQRLYRHMWWADALVATALEHARGGSRRAGELYAHVLGAELVWCDRVEGVEQSVPVWPQATLAECRDLARRVHHRYEQFLSRLTGAELGRLVHYRNSAGQEFDTRLDDILLHVVLHGCYHRGQVALLLRDAGAEPAPTDFIGFVRGIPAATRRSTE